MPRSIELFAGGGGMALGMLGAGFVHDQLVEIYPAACDSLRKNAERNPALWKKENVVEADIRQWLTDRETRRFEGIDLVAGGPPCQPFSIGAGSNASHANDRNMFPAAAECVALLRPRTFVFENVPGLLRSSFIPYYEYIADRLARPALKPRPDEDWATHHARIKRSRQKVEYEVRILIVEAADLGVPQTRKRVFIIGSRADTPEKGTFEGIVLPYSRDALLYEQWVTGEYWERRDLKPPEIPQRLAARVRYLRAMDSCPQGKPWRTTRDAISDFPEPVDGKETDGVLNHKGIPGARRYRGHTGGWIDWPAKTLKAGVHGVCGGEAMIRFSDETLRYLTVREAAAVQTFPNDYLFPETRTAAMRLIGNAVAVTVAQTIGLALRPLLDGRHQPDAPTGSRIARAVSPSEITSVGTNRPIPKTDPSKELQGSLW